MSRLERIIHTGQCVIDHEGTFPRDKQSFVKEPLPIPRIYECVATLVEIADWDAEFKKMEETGDNNEQ